VPFKDLFPFKRPLDQTRGNYGIAPSVSGSPGRAVKGPRRRDASPGRRGQYRLALTSMPVPGLPDAIHVGRVVIEQAEGPVWTQRTHVLQKPGWRPTYVKHMDQDVIAVGSGYRITVCTIEVTLPEDVITAMREWRDEVLAAVGFVVAVLDERIAQEVLAEDLLLFDDAGEAVGAADHVQQVRAFAPKQRVLEEHRAVLAQLAPSDPGASDPVVAAARWYLRGAQSGRTPDSIVFLWIALEALSKPPYGTKLSKPEKKLTDVQWVEQALREAGVDPSVIKPNVGRLAGLRAEVVHGGVESPALLAEGYGVLEALTRVLLRYRLGTGPMGWPAFPGMPNLVSPLREVALLLTRFPKTQWRKSP
jgi:hypothetical protein